MLFSMSCVGQFLTDFVDCFMTGSWPVCVDYLWIVFLGSSEAGLWPSFSPVVACFYSLCMDYLLC